MNTEQISSYLLAKIDILHKELQELVDLKNQEPSKEEQS